MDVNEAKLCARVRDIPGVQVSARSHLRLSRDFVSERLFGALKKDITPYIIDIFEKQFQIDAKEVCTKLFIVGGGAENAFVISWLKGEIERCFDRAKKTHLMPVVILPDDKFLAVLTGAVLRGTIGNIPFARLARLTLGIGVWLPYSQDKHGDWDALEEDKRFTDPKGGRWVGPRFETLVKKGTLMTPLQTTTSQTLEALDVIDDKITFTVYESNSDPPPDYVDLLTRKGSAKFDAKFGDNLKVSFSFDGPESELNIKFKNLTTGDEQSQPLTYSMDNCFCRA